MPQWSERGYRTLCCNTFLVSSGCSSSCGKSCLNFWDIWTDQNSWLRTLRGILEEGRAQEGAKVAFLNSITAAELHVGLDKIIAEYASRVRGRGDGGGDKNERVAPFFQTIVFTPDSVSLQTSVCVCVCVCVYVCVCVCVCVCFHSR